VEKTSPREQTVLNSLASATFDANGAKRVEVEASFTKGLPAFTIVGLASESIKESKERVKSALLNNNYTFPPLRITINLSPSDLKKEGSHFDLPIALLIALQKEALPEQKDENLYVFGELGLDGRVKDSAHIYPIVLSLAKIFPGIKVLTSVSSAKKLAAIPSVEAYGVETVAEATAFFKDATAVAVQNPRNIDALTLMLDKPYYYRLEYPNDFIDVVGQKAARRAALISAAGMHNILFTGSPGSGKSMIIKRLVDILPPLSLEELLETAMLESREGKEPEFTPRRAFRQPHHTATRASIFGGGSRDSRMGEVALAHGGILFFDELPHFPKTILEALREPLEDHRLLISRVNTKIEYQAAFLFAAAMNPCPCGNLLSQRKECRCTELEVQRYQNRLSEPFLERIDLFVAMDESGSGEGSRESSSAMHEQVLQAFAMQKKRGQAKLNGKMDDGDVERFCLLDQDVQTLLERAVEQYGLSMRGQNKVRKVARTIADLDASETISKSHLLEALGLRHRT
jgi:magnesium chelatase family protein